MKSKLTIILCSLIGVLAIAGVIVALILSNNKVTISFDSDGGSKVESIKVTKGETATLPTSTKEGFEFDGWYYNDLKANENSRFQENITLKARWKEVDKIKITFDSNGGSKVEDIYLAKDESFKEPAKPTKNGYNFIGWYDSNEVAILDGALLAEDITLYAKWEKVEEAKPKKYTITFDSNGGSKVNSITVNEGTKLTLPKDPTKENSVFNGWFNSKNVQIKTGTVINENMTLKAQWKNYTCPSGYSLNNKKCTIENTVKTKCGERGFDYEGKCVTISGSVRKESQRECGTKTIIKPYGHTEVVKGELFQMGTYYCYYGVVTDSYEQQNSSNCTSRGHKWNNSNSKCYYDRDDANVNITYSCPNGYAHISNPNTYSGINGLNGGCFPLSDKIKYCSDGFTLTNNICIKTIDATLE